MKAIELEKSYNPKDFEDKIYDFWEIQGCIAERKFSLPLEIASAPFRFRKGLRKKLRNARQGMMGKSRPRKTPLADDAETQ